MNGKYYAEGHIITGNKHIFNRSMSFSTTVYSAAMLLLQTPPPSSLTALPLPSPKKKKKKIIVSFHFRAETHSHSNSFTWRQSNICITEQADLQEMWF